MSLHVSDVGNLKPGDHTTNGTHPWKSKTAFLMSNLNTSSILADYISESMCSLSCLLSAPCVLSTQPHGSRVLQKH